MSVALARNLFEENDVLRLPQTSQMASTGMPEIAGIEIKINRNGDSTWPTRISAIEIALRTIHSSLSNWQIWLLGCHGTWQPDSRIVSYRKLWKSLETRGLKLPKGNRLEELEQKTDEGQRWFSGIEIDINEISLIGPILNDEPYSIITIFPNGVVPDLKTIMDNGWVSVRDSGLNGWASIATEICRSGGVLLRPFGEFDDVEVGIDIFSTWLLAEKFHGILKN